MRFLVTMNMPSASGNSVHQVTVDHSAASVEQLCEILNTDIFIICRNFYRRTDNTGAMYWEDRGEIILNSAHIGKVQAYLEMDKINVEEPAPGADRRAVLLESHRGPIRPKRS